MTGDRIHQPPRLPINGKQYRFERILVLPGDNLWFEMTYSNWQVD